MQYLELTAGVVDGVLVVFPSYLINKNAPFKTNYWQWQLAFHSSNLSCAFLSVIYRDCVKR